MSYSGKVYDLTLERNHIMYVRRNGKCFWGSNCMCYSIPILKTEDEFFDDEEDTPSVNEVEDVPQGFKDWIKDNEERIERAEKRGTLPYFIADNRETVKRILEHKAAKDKEQARIEANHQEYERLKADPNYTDVEFNPVNGGLRAAHIDHEKHTDVDKKRLAFGTMTPWDLELECQDILYQNGYSCIFNSEHVFDPITKKQLKVLDTTTNGMPMDIVSITENGKNTIKNAFDRKKKQLRKVNEINSTRYDRVILHFHDSSFYNEENVRKGLGKTLKQIICVINSSPMKVIVIE